MRIWIGLDGVVCQLHGHGGTCANGVSVDGTVQRLRFFCAGGHEVIIDIERHMKTGRV